MGVLRGAEAVWYGEPNYNSDRVMSSSAVPSSDELVGLRIVALVSAHCCDRLDWLGLGGLIGQMSSDVAKLCQGSHSGCKAASVDDKQRELSNQQNISAFSSISPSQKVQH